jgi:hypothetical protein
MKEIAYRVGVICKRPPTILLYVNASSLDDVALSGNMHASTRRETMRRVDFKQ